MLLRESWLCPFVVFFNYKKKLRTLPGFLYYPTLCTPEAYVKDTQLRTIIMLFSIASLLHSYFASGPPIFKETNVY